MQLLKAKKLTATPVKVNKGTILNFKGFRVGTGKHWEAQHTWSRLSGNPA